MIDDGRDPYESWPKDDPPPGFRFVLFGGGWLSGCTRLIREPIVPGMTYSIFVPVPETWAYDPDADQFRLVVEQVASDTQRFWNRLN